MYNKHKQNTNKRGDFEVYVDAVCILLCNCREKKIVSRGFFICGFCLSDAETGTDELIVYGKKSRYRQRNTETNETRTVWRIEKSV